MSSHVGSWAGGISLSMCILRSLWVKIGLPLEIVYLHALGCGHNEDDQRVADDGGDGDEAVERGQ